MEGWICLHRKMLDWEWYSDANTFRLFIHLLLLANHEEKKWKGQVIKRGQLITSSEHLAEDLKLSRQQIRTSINKLKSTTEITTKSTNRFLLITIEKYGEYQDIEKENNQQNNQQLNNQITNKQPTDNQQITTNNNDNNIYIYLFNKYKRNRNTKNMSEYLKANREMQKDEKWAILNYEQQMDLLAK